MMTSTQKKGCLILHGFGGALYEIEPLALYLREHDFIVNTPSLKGHGGSRTDNKQLLRHVDYHDWLTNAEEALNELAETVDEIYVIGFSMGGLIATHLAINSPHTVKALVLLNTPYYFWDLGNISKNLLEDLKTGKAHHLKHYLHSGGKLPLNAVYQFQKLLHLTKHHFSEIACPLMVIQSLDDDSVQPRSAQAILNKTISHIKEVLMIDRGGHLVLLSAAKETVCHAVHEFLVRKI